MSNVPRGTMPVAPDPDQPVEVEPEPAFAADLFGDSIDLARRFVADLAEHGIERGLIGPLEPARLWTRHVINSALLAPLLRPGRVGDLGSGAGLPGLVLALARPDVQLVLIEPMERRVAWLQEESDRLGLTNVEVVRARAEEARVAPLNQITARAVKAFSGLIPMAVPLLAPGGELIFLKGASAQAEIEAAAKPIRRFHLHNVEVITLGEPWGTESTNVIRASLVTEVAPG